ncbi:UNVERIFIED_ORG: hypothetical protein M2438_002030 [Methylobacterium sp. SuP10 SLI 274]|uniref:hypothetical protein n=1 Tax=Methylorubrum extorquens TaxID=408 RepID=UPI0020A07E42|nr:hypothetical protein [Methylorubrum extorquens]MDF9863244.1 hypothetical protein [Methylorubrum pseudosasae]MDH6636855.1 hypothetical protein [Methylobacterium sp. SuP10 SLI 274]MDH6666032.1 hypothetical protein [Methylorubrum zatmanii]MCP1557947.1 hypothetical protein [Methylorubrum extorquens]MDF9791552.1 hypothetical protein [Methylorubrum extorquens]
MTTGTDFELRLAAFADLVQGMRPPGMSVDELAPPVGASVRPRLRLQVQAASLPIAIHAAPNTTSQTVPSQYLNQSQARAICTSASFVGQAYGQCFNLFLIFRHLGDDHVAGADAVNDFHRRARQRLSYRGQVVFPFIYVHEVERDGRLSTRLACQVEFERDEKFLPWIGTGFATSRAGRRATVGEVRYHEGHARAGRVAFHHRCVRELLRGVDPTLVTRDEKGRHARLIDCLGVRLDERRPLGSLTCAQRFGTADALGRKSQAAADDALPLLNAFDDGAWPWFGRGWELAEYDARLAEMNALAEERRLVDVRWPVSTNTLVKAERATALAAFEARRTRSPEYRKRSWDCWRQAGS